MRQSERDTGKASSSPDMSRDEERRILEQRLVEKHGAAWVEENRAMLDAQWEEMIEWGLVKPRNATSISPGAGQPSPTRSDRLKPASRASRLLV